MGDPMTLPALSTTDRYALKELRLEQGGVVHPGKAMWCRGRTVIRIVDLSRVTFPLPKGVNTLVVSPADFPAVKEWIG